jgi:hypothetical protein
VASMPSNTQVIVSSIIIAGVILWLLYDGYVYFKRRRWRPAQSPAQEGAEPGAGDSRRQRTNRAA